jgi:hypothetical protein
MKDLRRGLLLVLLAVAAGFGVPQRGGAQPKPAATPNPAAPNITGVSLTGAQRGSGVELTLTGTNLAEPTRLWTSFPAEVSIPQDMNNGKEAGKLRVKMVIPRDTAIGFHAFRLATSRGMSNLRLFCIDDLPEVPEVDTNRAKTTPQAVSIPCVVLGRADPEVSDWFKISAGAGQRVSFEILGRRLGSAFDPQLTLYDARSGRELPGGHSNDAPGLQTDPRLTYTFKDAGDYLIEVRDVLYRGGADFHYRLRIGDFPCATNPIPMAAKRGSKTAVHFAGTMVEGIAPMEVTVPSDPNIDTLWLAPRGANGLLGWPVALGVSDLDEAVETEPNNEPAKANRIPVPGAVTARFQEKGDVDYFVFGAKKGQRLIIEAQTLELYSPTDVYMILKDAKGTQLAATNPANPPRLDYTAPADGDLTLHVEHLHLWGGPTETYRVTVTPYEPGFDLSLALDRYDLFPGGFASIPIQVTRRDYAGPIEVSVVGPPGFSGQMTISTGQPPQPGQVAGALTLWATPDLLQGAYTIGIVGKATINGKAVTQYASSRAVITQALGGLPYPPRHLFHDVGIAITEKPPFTLAATFDLAEALRGTAASVTITATRQPGFTEEIAITTSPLPANVAAALKNIAKGQNEVKVTLTPAAAAAMGQFPITFTGKAKVQAKEFTVSALPATLNVALPFDLQVAPAPLKVQQGGKAVLKVTAARKGGYAGPITVEVRNLPANVTAAKGTVAMGQNAVDVEITAAPAAAVADKADVNVLGTATAAANQTNASKNFTVSVTKK